MFHHIDKAFRNRINLRFFHFEDEFIVDLQQHISICKLLFDHRIDLQHRKLDEIGGTPLKDSVDRFTHKGGFLHAVRILVVKKTASAKQCFDITVYFYLLLDPFKVLFDRRE